MKELKKNWQEIGNIKNLKEGYLSQAIHQIYQLVIKHNAFIVLEDLNTQFKAERLAKVEKSIYKKFELNFAKKLNHLILKDKKPNDPGGVLNAYQLTPLIDSGKVGYFEKSKQWGIILYVRPDYTSTTDPVTGWRKHHYISNFETIEKIKNFFDPKNKGVGISIFYSNGNKCWGFRYKHKETNKIWELLAIKELNRFKYNNSTKKNEKISLHKRFEELFAKFDKNKDIYSQFAVDNEFNWKTLVYLWNFLNQIRNADRDTDDRGNDFIQSPVYSEKIKGFFDSRKYRQYEFTYPDNGDANGAYNIARKGLLMIKRIKDNLKEKNLYIKNEDWDRYAVQNTIHWHK